MVVRWILGLKRSELLSYLHSIFKSRDSFYKNEIWPSPYFVFQKFDNSIGMMENFRILIRHYNLWTSTWLVSYAWICMLVLNQLLLEFKHIFYLPNYELSFVRTMNLLVLFKLHEWDGFKTKLLLIILNCKSIPTLFSIVSQGTMEVKIVEVFMIMVSIQIGGTLANSILSKISKAMINMDGHNWQWTTWWPSPLAAVTQSLSIYRASQALRSKMLKRTYGCRAKLTIAPSLQGGIGCLGRKCYRQSLLTMFVFYILASWPFS